MSMMSSLVEKLRMYAALYDSPPYGREIEGTKELLTKAADAIAALREKQHMEELRQKSRLIELPCAIGDLAYWISDEDEEGNRVPTVRKTTPIKGIAVEEDGWYIRTEGEYDKVGERWAYLTLEDAQKALQKMKGENEHSGNNTKRL